jgi:hypothetical protein
MSQPSPPPVDEVVLMDMVDAFLVYAVERGVMSDDSGVHNDLRAWWATQMEIHVGVEKSSRRGGKSSNGGVLG